MNPIYVRGQVDRTTLEAREPGDPIWFVATTEGRKADGLDLQMDKLDIDRYRKNPIIGYGHRFFGRDQLPIGRAVDIAVDAAELRLQVAFDQADQFATQVEQKVADGYLNAMSVGFNAYGIDNSTGIPERWELFESSVVPIPMDPDALAQVGRSAVQDLEDMLVTARAAFEPDLPPGWEIERDGDTVEAITVDGTRYVAEVLDDDNEDDDPPATPSRSKRERRYRETMARIG